MQIKQREPMLKRGQIRQRHGRHDVAYDAFGRRCIIDVVYEGGKIIRRIQTDVTVLVEYIMDHRYDDRSDEKHQKREPRKLVQLRMPQQHVN